ncbi:general odorant-binding protein 83a-like [Toxorhynchites rutilus septentrionalis]|uniref:general odorant-binding protein 83a-like n=1 Tax=Toxorhynchites rutilus septentrionalis TaxID=329112 RepID=UPI00247924E0|nr:general odorant-binding protein 83a-like [Toxorhynchites rutilus septentrionalis]
MHKLYYRWIFVMITQWILSTLVEAAPQREPNFPPASLIEMTADKHRSCVDETGVSEDSIARFNGPEIFDDDERLKCYMDCMFRRFNVTDPDGEVNMIEVYHAIPKQLNSVALKVSNVCRDSVEGSTLCERAFSHHKCWKQADPIHYYLF